jgi:hypothetical protein
MVGLWVNGPVGTGAGERVLRVGCRTVLVVVPFVVAGTRLMDVLPLLEADHRVSVVFTVAPAASGSVCHGTEDFLRARGGLVLPWHQAVHCEFDLILAASPTGLDVLHGKVMLLSHGASTIRPLLRARSAGVNSQPTHDLDREALLCRGRLVPHALALNVDAELAVLRHSCPEAVPVAVVAGDICYDRLVASVPFRERYRRALSVREGQKLVTVTSTWQPESLFGQHPELIGRLVSELAPDEYRVAAVLHPNIWSVHGEFQIRTWLADCLNAGLLLLPPDEGWRAAVIAADLIVGDYGSVTRYGAALGIPFMLAAFPERDVRPDSVAAALYRIGPLMRPDKPLTGQIRAAGAARDRAWQDVLASGITSRSGRAGAILRRTMYRLLDLPEPARGVPVSPVPLPKPVAATAPTWDAP